MVMLACASFEIRRARPEDSQALSALAFASKRHWPYPPEALEGWRDDLTITPQMITTSHAAVADDATGAIGFFVLLPSPGPAWVLEHFWIAPAAMGRGVGRALLQHALADAAFGGATSVTIDADPFAEGFYLACGACRIDTVAAPIVGMPDRVRPQLCMPVRRSLRCESER